MFLAELNDENRNENDQIRRHLVRQFLLLFSIVPAAVSCDLFWWFVKSVFNWKQKSMPYILAFFRDEIGLVALEAIWKAVQNALNSIQDFEEFLYMAPFINLFDAIDCFRRNSEHKRAISKFVLLLFFFFINLLCFYRKS